METSFTVGEIVWAKIRGYPWWPAMITGTKDDSKEKKYIINFIGDNTHANLNKKDLAKFEKEYKTYSNTKKKDLLDSIKKAKELYETKEEKQNKITPTIEEKPMQSISLSPLKPLESNSSKKDDSSVSLLKRKTKRSSDSKGTSDLIQKIIAYISNVVKLISSKTIDKVLNDKECILKIMEYLKEYKMNEPIDFLKRTNLGKMIKYILINLYDTDIKLTTQLVYDNFESQVVSNLIRKSR